MHHLLWTSSPSWCGAASAPVRAFRSSVHGFVAIEAADGFGMAVDVDASFDRLVATLAGGLSKPGRAQPA